MREVDLTFLDWQRGLNATTTNTGGSYYKTVDAEKTIISCHYLMTGYSPW